MSLIRELAEAGAFADNAWSTYESATTNLFLEKKAAMQMDGSWIQSSFTYGMMDTLRVLPMPLRNGEGVSDCYLGGVSMGFYLTRRAWESAARKVSVNWAVRPYPDGCWILRKICRRGGRWSARCRTR